jgi:hypothetical protein
MFKLIVSILIITVACPLWAGNIQVTEFRDEEIDLIDPVSGEYLKTIGSKDLTVPLVIEKELDNGTYLVTLNGEKVCLDSGSVKTDKVYNIENIQDCNNMVKSNYVAASRGLGKGCLE